jgi:hypothetical protein
MADAAEEEDPPGYVEAEVREFFDKFDSDGSGNVNPDEFRELCEELQPGMEDEAKEEALQELDGDGDGEISFAGASSTLVVVWQRVCDSFHCTSVMVGVSTDAQTGRCGCRVLGVVAGADALRRAGIRRERGQRQLSGGEEAGESCRTCEGGASEAVLLLSAAWTIAPLFDSAQLLC